MSVVVAQVNETPKKISRISWGAVFAGAISVVSLSFLMSILGMAIGVLTVDPLTEASPLNGLGTGAVIWWILTNLAALFSGGLVAARMSGYTSNIDGALHGFLAWAVYLIIGLLLMTTAISSTLNGLGNMVSGLFGSEEVENLVVGLQKGNELTQERTTASYDRIKEQMFELVNTGERFNLVDGNPSEETREFLSESKQELKRLNLENDIEVFFNDLMFYLNKQGDLDINVEGSKDFINGEEIKKYLTENTELSEAEIDGVIEKWQQRMQTMVERAETNYAKTKQKLEVIGEEAAEIGGKVGIISFLILLLGAGAAFLGGIVGSPDYVVLVGEERKKRLKN